MKTTGSIGGAAAAARFLRSTGWSGLRVQVLHRSEAVSKLAVMLRMVVKLLIWKAEKFLPSFVSRRDPRGVSGAEEPVESDLVDKAVSLAALTAL